MDCGSPDCMNNTEIVIVDGRDLGGNATYVCDDGYAVVEEGGERSSVISTVCMIELSPSPIMAWKPLTTECQRTFVHCLLLSFFQLFYKLRYHRKCSFIATRSITFTKLECIPVGCVPPACWLYPIVSEGVSAPDADPPGRRSHPGCRPCPLDALPPECWSPPDADPWSEGMTHICENVTLHQTSFAGAN